MTPKHPSYPLRMITVQHLIAYLYSLFQFCFCLTTRPKTWTLPTKCVCCLTVSVVQESGSGVPGNLQRGLRSGVVGVLWPECGLISGRSLGSLCFQAHSHGCRLVPVPDRLLGREPQFLMARGSPWISLPLDLSEGCLRTWLYLE